MEILQVIDVVPTPEGWWVGLWRVGERTRWAVELHDNVSGDNTQSPFVVGDLYEYRSANGEGEMTQIAYADVPAKLLESLPVQPRRAHDSPSSVFGVELVAADRGSLAGVAHPRDPGRRYAN